MINQAKTNYVDMIKSVKASLLESDKAETVLTNMGAVVAEYYGSKETLEETKAQFQADAILPIINKRHAEALAKDLPRKGSKEFNAMGAPEQAKWELANQAKKDARSTIGVYYSRVVKYAFPAEKKESAKKDFAGKLKALIDEGGKLKEADFDLVKVMGFLIQAEATIIHGNKPLKVSIPNK
jgi:hypothetical protein